jgi:hypothetical protein
MYYYAIRNRDLPDRINVIGLPKKAEAGHEVTVDNARYRVVWSKEPKTHAEAASLALAGQVSLRIEPLTSAEVQA